MDLSIKAKELGIHAGFIDAQGRQHVTDEAALKTIVEALPHRAPHRFLDDAVVVRSGFPARSELKQTPAWPLHWKIMADEKVVAEGDASAPQNHLGNRDILWPPDLPTGSYRVHVADAKSFSDEAPFIVAPRTAYEGDFDRCWLLAVQLYGIRSAHNWGIGDFSDLERLIELAARLGADGIGINPLHVLFDDRPGDCSPYSPNSRLFLNPLYVDVEKLPGFQPSPDDSASLARLRQSEIIDYVEVAALKWRALRSAFDEFKANPKGECQQEFENFRTRWRAPVVTVRLLRGAPAQIPEAVVGMAARMATTR